MKKLPIKILSFLFILLLIVLWLRTLDIQFWLSPKDAGFERSSDVKRTLEQTIPGREYSLRYYISGSNKNSLQVEYTDPEYTDTYQKYADVQNGTGEFAVLGTALCQDYDLRSDLGYETIIFRVRSAGTTIRKFYENSFTCFEMSDDAVLEYTIGSCPENKILCGGVNADEVGCTSEYRDWVQENCEIISREQ